MATNAGKTTIPLTSILSVGGRRDVNQPAAPVSDYVSVRFENSVFLLAAEDGTAFKTALYEALLDGTFMLVRHPAIKGGVVQEREWEKCRLAVEGDRVGVAIANGSFVDVVLDDIGGVTKTNREVAGDRRAVIETEHTDGATSVEAYLSGPDNRCEVLGQLFGEGAEQNRVELRFDGNEERILMALYSDVSPFEVPAFLGPDVDEIEAVYERLTEVETLNEERLRRGVTLTTRGRNVASEAIGDDGELSTAPRPCIELLVYNVSS